MKDQVKKLLQKWGWYESIRFSAAMWLYKRWTRHPEYRLHQRELAFYRSFLSSPGLIFDIGAHHGFKSAVFLEMGAAVVACEPDGSNAGMLRHKFRRQGKRMVIRQEAVGEHAGEARFHVHHPGSAFNTLKPEWKDLLENDPVDRWNEKIRFQPVTEAVKVVTLEQLIKDHGVPDFIKIDAEGYEEEIVNGLHVRVPYLSVESLWPEFIPSLRSIIAHLQGLTRRCRFNICVDEHFIFADFQDIPMLDAWLAGSPVPHFEVVFQLE